MKRTPKSAAALDRRQFNRLAALGTAAMAVPTMARGFAGGEKATYTYKKVGDIEIKADVYNGSANGRRPTVIWIHGGALILGNRDGIMQGFHDRLIAADWTVVSIDYRLAPETRLPEIHQDLIDACQWVHEEGPKLF